MRPTAIRLRAEEKIKELAITALRPIYLWQPKAAKSKKRWKAF
jgi:hypothetical protein